MSVLITKSRWKIGGSFESRRKTLRRRRGCLEGNKNRGKPRGSLRVTNGCQNAMTPRLLTPASISFMTHPRCIREGGGGSDGPRISVAFTRYINVLFTFGTLQWQDIFSLHLATLYASHSRGESRFCTPKHLSNKRCGSRTILSSRMESMSISGELSRIPRISIRFSSCSLPRQGDRTIFSPVAPLSL